MSIMKRCETLENTLSVYCLKYAESVLPQNMVFYGGDKNIKIPISFSVYLIKTKDKNILVDAGCDTMPGFIMKRFYSPAFVLRSVGVTSDEITDVIITHSHHDHIEAVRHFNNAVIHISSAEYEQGKRYIPDGVKANVFENEYVFDSQLKVIEWGGHSKGSAIVEVESDSITHVLCGDECYINECITKKISTGAYCDLEKSRAFVKTYSGKKYIVHTCHDAPLKTERII